MTIAADGGRNSFHLATLSESYVLDLDISFTLFPPFLPQPIVLIS